MFLAHKSSLIYYFCKQQSKTYCLTDGREHSTFMKEIPMKMPTQTPINEGIKDLHASPRFLGKLL